MDWKRIFNNKYTLTFIQYYNLILLVLYTIGCYIYLIDIDFYKYIYKIFVSILGCNLASQVFVGYLLSKLKFCKWQLLAFMFNLIINVLVVIFNLLSEYYEIQCDLIIMTLLGTIFSIYTITYMIFELKNVKQKRRSKTILR